MIVIHGHLSWDSWDTSSMDEGAILTTILREIKEKVRQFSLCKDFVLGPKVTHVRTKLGPWSTLNTSTMSFTLIFFPVKGNDIQGNDILPDLLLEQLESIASAYHVKGRFAVLID